MSNKKTIKRSAETVFRGGVRAKLKTKNGIEEHVIFYDTGAEIALMELLDKTKYEAYEAFSKNANPIIGRALIWAGLLHENPELEVEECGKYALDDETILCISAALKNVELTPEEVEELVGIEATKKKQLLKSSISMEADLYLKFQETFEKALESTGEKLKDSMLAS